MSSSGAGQSSVGSRAIYEAGDQRNVPQSEINEQNRYAEGQKNSHKNLDSSMPPSSLLPSNHSGDIVLTKTNQRTSAPSATSLPRKNASPRATTTTTLIRTLRLSSASRILLSRYVPSHIYIFLG